MKSFFGYRLPSSIRPVPPGTCLRDEVSFPFVFSCLGGIPLPPLVKGFHEGSFTFLGEIDRFCVCLSPVSDQNWSFEARPDLRCEPADLGRERLTHQGTIFDACFRDEIIFFKRS